MRLRGLVDTVTIEALRDISGSTPRDRWRVALWYTFLGVMPWLGLLALAFGSREAWYFVDLFDGFRVWQRLALLCSVVASLLIYYLLAYTFLQAPKKLRTTLLTTLPIPLAMLTTALFELRLDADVLFRGMQFELVAVWCSGLVAVASIFRMVPRELQLDRERNKERKLYGDRPEHLATGLILVGVVGVLFLLLSAATVACLAWAFLKPRLFWDDYLTVFLVGLAIVVSMPGFVQSFTDFDTPLPKARIVFLSGSFALPAIAGFIYFLI
jgi:hypothetical protein